MVVVASPTAEVTNSVVATWVVLVRVAAVGAVGTPVSAGEASGAKPEMDAPAGIVTVPVKVGLAMFAFPLMSPAKELIVAILVAFVITLLMLLETISIEERFPATTEISPLSTVAVPPIAESPITVTGVITSLI